MYNLYVLFGLFVKYLYRIVHWWCSKNNDKAYLYIDMWRSEISGGKSPLQYFTRDFKGFRLLKPFPAISFPVAKRTGDEDLIIPITSQQQFY